MDSWRVIIYIIKTATNNCYSIWAKEKELEEIFDWCEKILGKENYMPWHNMAIHQYTEQLCLIEFDTSELMLMFELRWL